MQLVAIKSAGVPLLVVTGGWSPAFDATGRIVAATGGGRHQIIRSPHHFPNIVSDVLGAAMIEADRTRGR